ncbi:MAG TPA: cupin domain-containing protein [Thermomicrobiales bacterium]|nr:cupin domain-containing protein [Thermomicrobiales bacterium]
MSDQRPASAQVIAWAAIPEEEVLPGITRQVYHGQEQTVVRYVYNTGSVFPMHAHPQEQMTAVLRGRMTFTVDDPRGGPPRQIELGPGEIAMLPANLPHGAEVVGPEDVETLNTLSPRRPDAPIFDARERRP